MLIQNKSKASTSLALDSSIYFPFKLSTTVVNRGHFIKGPAAATTDEDDDDDGAMQAMYKQREKQT